MSRSLPQNGRSAGPYAPGFQLVCTGTGGSVALSVILLGKIFGGKLELGNPLLMASVAILSIFFGAMIVAGIVKMSRARSGAIPPGELPPEMITANLRGAFYGALVGMLGLLILG